MTTFESLGLSEDIIQSVSQLGFVTPTPIQEKTIPVLLENERDFVGLAQTGTGKTAAFGLPLIQLIDRNTTNTQALILSPTRELCLQIANDLKSFAANSAGLNIVAVYGGASAETQITALKKGAQIVVGTPGRTLDLIGRKKLKVDNIRFMVLDEADEMLTMGFKDELDGILENTPSSRQTLLFSATMPDDIVRISKQYMNDPLEVTAGKRNEGTSMVEHMYYMVHARDRYEALKRIADMNPKIYGIVFCRTRQETKDIADHLMRDGYNADALHGDLSQAQRDHVMNRFRRQHLQLLVATDVAARGLDVNDLTHVINYNLPDEAEVYIHRSGRTGRAGKRGISLSILHMREKHRLREIEKKIGKTFTQKPVPGGREICEKQLFNLIDKMEQVVVNEEQIAPFMDLVYKKLNWLDREDLIKRFVSVEFNRFLEYYRHATDLNAAAEKAPGGSNKNDRKERESRRTRNHRDGDPEVNFTRFFIDKGSKDNLNPASLIGLINKNVRDHAVTIGRIEIMKSFSFFEADSQFADMLVKSFGKATFNGTPVFVEGAAPKKTGFQDRGDDRKKSKKSITKGTKSKKPKRDGRKPGGSSRKKF